MNLRITASITALVATVCIDTVNAFIAPSGMTRVMEMESIKSMENCMGSTTPTQQYHLQMSSSDDVSVQQKEKF